MPKKERKPGKTRAKPDKKPPRVLQQGQDAAAREAAISDILRVISSSPTDLKPVMAAVVENAARLADANHALIGQAEGSNIRWLAAYGCELPGGTRPITRDLPSGRAMLDLQSTQVEDVAQIKGDPRVERAYRELGVRSIFATPLVREGRAIGVLLLRRTEVRPFSDKQVALLKTFADQAAIAIENVRLFNETKEALERQTATAEVLQVISSSPTDLKPVYETILANVTRLCEANFAALFLYDGEFLTGVAHHNATRQLAEAISRGGIRPSRETTTRLAALERRVVHVEDLLNDPAFSPPESTRREGTRTVLSVPLLRKGTLVGVITVWRREARLFTDKQVALVKTFADQAVIAIENVRLFNETKEALEQQTAVSDVLRVISNSPTDVQPVLQSVAERAARICEANDAAVVVLEGSALKQSAHWGVLGWERPPGDTVPMRGSIIGRAVTERVPVQVEDIAALPATESEFPFARQMYEEFGHRTVLAVPLLRENQALGAIVLRRKVVRPFSEKQIALLKTFADQAAIALENVRLFNETKEALEQQTATSEILGVISSSPTDLTPVFDAILKSALQLCEAHLGLLHLYDGEKYRTVAQRGASGEFAKYVFERGAFKPDGGYLVRAAAERRPVHIPDMSAEPAYLAGRPNTVKFVEMGGARTFLGVPLLKEDKVIGALVIYRPEVRPFTEKQIALISLFANQAVIAMENVRLFKELEARNSDLGQSLEQQTATSEILRVIAGSPNDVQPVFDTIVRNAAALCKGKFANAFRYDGELLHFAASSVTSPEARTLLAESYPTRPSLAQMSGRAVLAKTVVRMEDALSDPDYDRRHAEVGGWQRMLGVPMLREGNPIGAIVVAWAEPGPIPQPQERLLQTFADQAVIAVENVRLFNEINEALQQQTSTAEVLKTISRSTFDLDAVLQALLDNATRLSGAQRAVMLRPDAEGNYIPALTFNYGADSELIARMRERPIRPGRDSINGRVLLEKRPIHVPDVLADPEYGRQDLAAAGSFRTVLSVPMLRDGEAIGLIGLIKGDKVDPFTDRQMEVVTTFADQAVIAIENVRLFKEIEEKSAQLEVANKHKSDFLAHMSHELRTPLNAIIGFSEALMEKMFGELTDKQFDYLKDIHESGKHLLSLINDILDLSKIEAGRMELELSTFHLPTAISNAMTLVRERAQRHGVELDADVDPRLAEFQADERKLKQILLNLLSNAVKFTPQGGRVGVSAKFDTDRVEIAVKDSGVGISPQDQASLFEEFRQVGKDSTRKAEGTGLGLALTKRFVELHGGAIRVESAQGKGSTFTFSLPMRQ